MGEATETQAALRAALLADPGVSALVGGRVVDEPAGAALPFVRFARIEPAADDTDGAGGALVAVGLAVHSRPAAGRAEAQAICEAIKAALHRRPEALAVAGFAVVDVRVPAFVVERAGDGATYEGRVSVEVRISAPAG